MAVGALMIRLAVTLMLMNVVQTVRGLDVQWTQYSDRASLPRSKRWRDSMREKIASVDIDKLSSEDRTSVIWLRDVLAEDLYEEPEPPWTDNVVLAVVGIVGLVAIVMLALNVLEDPDAKPSCKYTTSNGMRVGGAMSASTTTSTSMSTSTSATTSTFLAGENLRNARLRKFESAHGQTQSTMLDR